MSATQRTRRNQPGEPLDTVHYYVRQQSRRDVHEMAAHPQFAESIAQLRAQLIARALAWVDAGEYELAGEQLLEVAALTPPPNPTTAPGRPFAILN